MTLERDVVRRTLEFNAAEAKAKEERLKRQKERETRARDEARRRAPGLSEQGDILQPIKATNPSRGDSNPSLLVDQPGSSLSVSPPKPTINIHEFENSILAPADPWESQKEKGDKDYDLTMLREVMGGPSVVSSSDTSPQKPAEPYVIYCATRKRNAETPVAKYHKRLVAVAQFHNLINLAPWLHLPLPRFLNQASCTDLHNTVRRSHNRPWLHLHPHHRLRLHYRNNFLV